MKKTVGPVTSLTFLGIDIDTVSMTVRVPVTKLNSLRLLLQPLLSKRKIKFEDLEALIGLLSFCSRAIISSRPFIRRFYEVLAEVRVKKTHFSVRVNSGMRYDVQMWLDILEKFSGVCFIATSEWLTNESLQLFTDSSGNADLGCGACFRGRWVQFKWPCSWSGTNILKDITLLELVPIVLALSMWSSHFMNNKIIFRVDNKALTDILNKRTSKSKRIMSLLRPHSFQVHAYLRS